MYDSFLSLPPPTHSKKKNKKKHIAIAATIYLACQFS